MTNFEIMDANRRMNPRWNSEREDMLDLKFYTHLAPHSHHPNPSQVRSIPYVMRYICGIYDIPFSIICGLDPDLVKKAEYKFDYSIMNYEGWSPSAFHPLVLPCTDYLELRKTIRNGRDTLSQLVRETLKVYTIAGEYLKKYGWNGWKFECLKPYKKGGIEDYK